MGLSFKILAFSDWRVQPFAPLCDYILKHQPDLVLYAGDDIERFGPIPRESLPTLLNDVEGFHAEIRFERVLVRSSNATDKRFRKDVTECLSQEFILSDLVAIAISEGVWITPSKSRKKEDCLFYWETGMSDPSYAEKLAASSKLGLGAVIGNDCSSRDKLRLNRSNVYDLHQKPLVKNRVAVLGLEGAPVGGPGIVLYEEEDALSHLETQWKQASSIGFDRSILVTHAPPKGILDLSARFGVNHIGSEAVRSFVETHNINLVICGHSHINGGKYTELSGATVLNIASHDHRDALGKVATIELTDDNQIAIDVDFIYPSGSIFLNSMPEVGRKRAEQLHALGIDSVTDFVEENRNRMVAIPMISDRMVSKWILHSKAIASELVLRLHHPSWADLDPSRSIVYDIETDLGPTHLWCIGLWDPEESKVVQFYEKNDEKKLLSEFFKFLDERKNYRLVSYSNISFDRKGIEDCARRTKTPIHPMLEKEIDLGLLVTRYTVGLPKGGLKQVAKYFGCGWSSKEMSGFMVGLLVSKYLSSGAEPNWEEMLQYNIEDVHATRVILEKVLQCDIGYPPILDFETQFPLSQ